MKEFLKDFETIHAILIGVILATLVLVYIDMKRTDRFVAECVADGGKPYLCRRLLSCLDRF